MYYYYYFTSSRVYLFYFFLILLSYLICQFLDLSYLSMSFISPIMEDYYNKKREPLSLFVLRCF